jgi:methylated-DNA-[protein]-cysteine S-methyltransferase
MNKQSMILSSPLGFLKLTADKTHLVSVEFVDDKDFVPPKDTAVSGVLHRAILELTEYFAGKRKHFTVPVKHVGTQFQLSVWHGLSTIPYGKTATYQDIAVKTGNIKAVRAVGRTNGLNKIAIVVPCHRVIGKNGKMVGYASGVWRKVWLLSHEQKNTM